MRRSLPLLTVLLVSWLSPLDVEAKPPTLKTLFPAGAGQGQSVVVTATGSFDHWPIKAWVDGPGVTIKAGEKKGELQITVASDAPPGPRWVRLYDEDGATTPRPFLVGRLAEVVETEPNDQPDKAQAIESCAVTVNGRLARRDDVDGFAVTLKKDQTLVAAFEANGPLGSPMDGVLQVASPRGIVLAQNDDEIGMDPRIVFTASEDGTYVVRTFAFPATPDSRIGFSGGDDYIYRLTLTTGGFLDHVYPLAVTVGTPVEVEGRGWNIPEEARKLAVEESCDCDCECEPGAETAASSSGLIRVGHPLLANTVELLREGHPAIVEQGATDLEHPQPITVPVTVSGRIEPAGDRDVFAFAAKKGDKLLVRVESRSLGQPLDPVLRVLDASGKTLTEVDDLRRGGGRDPELSFTAPGDGDFRLSVHDLHGRGGERFVYRLKVERPEPDFALNASADQVALTSGKETALTVKIDRQQGFDGPLAVRVEGLPNGVTAEPVTSDPKGKTAREVSVKLKGTREPWSGAIRIVGRSEEPTPRTRAAKVAVAGFEATLDTVWLTVLPEKAEKPASEKKDATK